MERDWERLGRAFAKARTAAGLTQEQAAERLHVSRTPVQAIERGRQPNGKSFMKVTATMRAYARLVGWTEESPGRILDGQEPEPATQPASPGAPSEGSANSGLPAAVDRELRTGKTLDHAVVNLGGESDDDTRLIVLLKGAEDLSEEQLDELWLKWRRMRRQLQAIPGESDTPRES